MKVWVTRAAPGAFATAGRLRDLGHDPIVAPLLTVERLPAAVDLTGVGAVAFTSANAVRAFADLEARRDLTAWAVGGATARAARDAGFRDVRSSDGDVAQLAAAIAAGQPAGTAVLHACAAELAGDLEAPLAAAGIGYVGLPLYRTHDAAVDETILGALREARAVLLHSPKGARALSRLLARRRSALERALCLSEAVAQALGAGKIRNVTSAALPNDAALLKLLEQGSPARP